MDGAKLLPAADPFGWGAAPHVAFPNRQPSHRRGGLLATEGACQHERTRLPNGDSHRDH